MVKLVVGGEFLGPEAKHALLLGGEAQSKGGDFFLELAGGGIEEGFLDSLREHVLEPGGEKLALLTAIKAREVEGEMVIADAASTTNVLRDNGGVNGGNGGKVVLAPLVHE